MQGMTTRRQFLQHVAGGAPLVYGWRGLARAAWADDEALSGADIPPLRVISGRPRERGLAYGTQFRDGIHAFLEREIYGPFVGKPASRADLLRYAAECAKVVREACPIVHEEVEGVAEGAELPVDEVVLISLHEELYHRGPLPNSAADPDDAPAGATRASGAPPGHCTAVAVGPPETADGVTLVGQTWDWMQSVFGLSSVVEWQRGEGPSVLAYGYPGLWTGAGLNSAGVALCWTSAHLEQKGLSPRVGVPSYLLIAHLLYQDSLESALAEARRDRHAGWFTFVLGDGAGRLANIEGSPQGIAVERLTGQLVRIGYGTRRMTSTSEDAEVPRHPRCEKMHQHLAAASGAMDLRRLQGIFEDPACEISVGKPTIDMLAFDTTRRAAYLSRGPAYHVAWKEFRFSDRPR
jgi:hypothetical protein